MDLLDALSDDHRRRLLDAATELRLGPGELLMRRGDRGGDLFRLQRGTLEVIDARTEPPVVLAVVGDGAMLGEMAFLDGSERTADVRAAEACLCLRWPRAELLAILEAEPALGLAVYRAFADLVNERSRNVRAVALDGRRPQSIGAPLAAAEDELVSSLRRRLLAVEPKLRTAPEAGAVEIRATLDVFLDGLVSLAERLGVEGRRVVLPRIGEHARPWLMRSLLGELAVSPGSGHTDDPAVLAHLLDGRPAGDGELGERIDAWLLALPTSAGLRDRTGIAIAQAVDAAPRRVVVINGEPSGSRAALEERLPGAVVTGLDGPSLAAWVLGDEAPSVPGQDLVFVDGLLDSLPDRVAAPLLDQVRGWLAPGGRMIGTSLAGARDADLFRFVLGWPQVHRRERAVEGLLTRAGWGEVARVRCGAGLVWSARPSGS